MCTVRRSFSFRPFAWMVTVLALFVFALAPAGWAVVDIVDAGGGTEGDPTDGLGVRGGGGSIFNGDTSSPDSVVDQPRSRPILPFEWTAFTIGPRIFVNTYVLLMPFVFELDSNIELGGNR